MQMEASVVGADDGVNDLPVPITPAAALLLVSAGAATVITDGPTTPVFLFDGGGEIEEASATQQTEAQQLPAQELPAQTRRFLQPTADVERNSKRRQTNFKIVAGDKSILDRNVILPLSSLVKFIENNFVCKRCRKRLISTGLAEHQSQAPFELEVYGLACGINFRCDCGAAASLRPDVIAESAPKIVALHAGKPFQNRLNSGDFEINRRFHLGLQLCGVGRQDGTVMAGLLKLNVNPMRRRWTEIQETLAKAIIKVGLEVLDENLFIECRLSHLHEEKGRYALEVASDTRWDKRGSTRRYDSLSGCSVAFGLRANLLIGIESMSSACIKCSKHIEHDADICPRNYEGSSKGMEASGAAKIVNRLFQNEEHKCYVASLVTDDDSSVRKILTHSYRDQVEASAMTDAEWPRYANGKKKPDNGMLPLLHPEICFLADKGHRVRGYSRFIFAEAIKSIAKGCGCTKIDAERMKRRLSWTLRLHCFGTYEDFQTAVLAVLEHHFNNHQYCGDWCQATSGTMEEVRASRLRFRCKEQNKELYDVLKKHHELFMEESKLRQLFHHYDTNTVEGFNKFLTKFLPKDRTYCRTIENRARTMLAVGLQSIGYRQFYQRVFALTGIKMTDDDITNLFLRSEDSQKLWRSLHRKRQDVKVSRMRTLYQKLKSGVEKLKVDNAKSWGYKSGMMGPGGSDEEHSRRPKKTKKNDKEKPICSHCGSSTHSRRTSRECPANIKNLKEKVAVEIDEGTS
jgi:hypothetical protein